MKYKFRIVPESGGYVGYALLNDEVVHTTSVCKDTIVASRSLTTFAASQGNSPNLEIRRPVRSAPVPAMVNSNLRSASPASNSSASASRRCCGRG